MVSQTCIPFACISYMLSVALPTHASGFTKIATIRADPRQAAHRACLVFSTSRCAYTAAATGMCRYLSVLWFRSDRACGVNLWNQAGPSCDRDWVALGAKRKSADLHYFFCICTETAVWQGGWVPDRVYVEAPVPLYSVSCPHRASPTSLCLFSGRQCVLSFVDVADWALYTDHHSALQHSYCHVFPHTV